MFKGLMIASTTTFTIFNEILSGELDDLLQDLIVSIIAASSQFNVDLQVKLF